MNQKKYYIAYGSNLSVSDMAVRCPNAKIAGMSYLKDWKLVFKFHATVEPCEGRVVPILVWEITEDDELRLDRYEGYPSYYYKQDMKIKMTDLDGNYPQEITAMIYIMDERHEVNKPSKGYYAILEEGYRRFGFNTFLLETALKESEESDKNTE